jgi:hypothetical protein
MLEIPATVAEEEVQKAIVPGAKIAIYEGSSNTFDIYEVLQYIPFKYPLQVTIAPNTPSVSITYNLPQFQNQTNPLYQLYINQQRRDIGYVFGLTSNSPFVSISATDPSGAPYWQVSPSFSTKVYPFGKIYAPFVWFAALPQAIPSITYNRKMDTLTPYPLSLPLIFTSWFIGYLLKFRLIEQNVPPDNIVEKANVVVYLYSPFKYIYSGETE